VVIASIRLELSIPTANSLKEKRRVVHSLVERLRSRYNASVTEVGEQGVWQRSVVGIALVSADENLAREYADKVISFVESHFEGEVCAIDVELL
jgi:uncharacterized protein YlxP (DUF503 family)